KARKKTSEDFTIYKIIYSGFPAARNIGCNCLKLRARPAGLEPATPLLRRQIQARIQNCEFSNEIRPLIFNQLRAGDRNLLKAIALGGFDHLHKDVATTMVYTHVLNRGRKGVRSPADSL